MVNIKCLLLGHKRKLTNDPVTTKLICKRCNAKIKKTRLFKRKKPVVRYCIREQKKNHFVAVCNISDITATGVSFQQAHNKFIENLSNHFDLNPTSEIRIIRDMKIK
jgi:hypothetical protein